jgi:hypothetical protein
LQAVEPKIWLGHCFSHNLHSHVQKRSALPNAIAHHHVTRTYANINVKFEIVNAYKLECICSDQCPAPSSQVLPRPKLVFFRFFFRKKTHKKNVFDVETSFYTMLWVPAKVSRHINYISFLKWKISVIQN